MERRLHGLLPDTLDPAQREIYDSITTGPRAAGPQHFALTDAEGRLLGPFNAMLLSPPVGGAVQALGSAVRYRSELTTRIREMAILAVAAHWGSTFEWDSHEAVGRAAGLGDAELEALRAGDVPDLDDPRERLAVTVAQQSAATGNVTDELYREATEALGSRAVFELTTLVGYYALLALQLRVFTGEEEAQFKQ